MIAEITVVMRKELLDLSRDRRTLYSMAGILIGLPLLYVILIGVMASQLNEHVERTMQVGVLACSRVASLCDFLRENRVEITPLEKLDTTLIASRTLDAVVEVPDDFSSDLASFRQARLILWYDEVEDTSSFTAKRLERLLSAWDASIGYRRAILRGVDPMLFRAIETIPKSIKPEKGFGYSSVQLFISALLMACFMGTYHLAVDSVAGEKERQSLEPLLQTASPRRALILGKWLSIVSIGIIGMLATALIFKTLVSVRILQDLLGPVSGISWRFVACSFLICLPLLFMASSLQFMIGTLSRSVKEAQTYASLLSLLGVLPGSFSSVLERLPSAVWIPNSGQALALLRLGKEQPVDWLACLVASGGTFLLALLFLLIVDRAFRSEKLFRSGS